MANTIQSIPAHATAWAGMLFVVGILIVGMHGELIDRLLIRYDRLKIYLIIACVL
jgi:hypothetical protein